VLDRYTLQFRLAKSRPRFLYTIADSSLIGAMAREVVEHYAAGGRLITEGPNAGDGRVSPLKSGLVRSFEASEEEIDAVVAFLEALTDESFVTNPALADPFE